MANALSCYRLAARTKAALMLPKYGCTGTPHPSVVQTSVLCAKGLGVYNKQKLELKNILGEEGCENSVGVGSYLPDALSKNKNLVQSLSLYIYIIYIVGYIFLYIPKSCSLQLMDSLYSLENCCRKGC